MTRAGGSDLTLLYDCDACLFVFSSNKSVESQRPLCTLRLFVVRFLSAFSLDTWGVFYAEPLTLMGLGSNPLKH